MTFEEFKDTREEVRSIAQHTGDEAYPDALAYLYEGNLYILIGDDEYDLFLYGEVVTSKDLNWLEERLYQFGIEEEYFNGN